MAQAQIIKGKFIKTPVFATESPTNSQTFRGVFVFSPDENIEESVRSNSKFQLPLIGTSEKTFVTLEKSEQEEVLKEYTEFVKKAQAIENPDLHSATNMDCASCHKAFAANIYDKHISPKPDGLYQHRFKADRWNLENLSATNLDMKSLQMFSFNLNRPKITQRVINESAESLHIMEKRNLLK